MAGGIPVSFLLSISAAGFEFELWFMIISDDFGYWVACFELIVIYLFVRKMDVAGICVTWPTSLDFGSRQIQGVFYWKNKSCNIKQVRELNERNKKVHGLKISFLKSLCSEIIGMLTINGTEIQLEDIHLFWVKKNK